MLNKYRMAATIIASAMIFQNASISFAFNNSSHMLKAVTSHDYEDFAGKIQDLIDDYDDEDNYLNSIEMRIGSQNMTVNGLEEAIDEDGTAANIYDGSTMIPARALAETLGFEVGWDSETSTVQIAGEDREVKIPVGKTVINIDGKSQDIPAEARIINGRTLVPARALCEALGCEVEWEDATRTVTIKRNFQTKRLIVRANNSSIDFKQYGAVDAIWDPSNEYAIVQFSSEKAAIEAYNKLKVNGAVSSVEPDIVMMENDLSAANTLSDMWDTDYTQIVNYANSIGSSRTMRFAVVDSGVNNVGMLSGKVEAGVNCIGNSGKAKDTLGHGTEVAGVIAKAMGNVDYKIVPVKITDTATFDMTASIFGTAIQGCIENNVDVINMSISIPYCEGSNYINDAIVEALSKNISVVVAAGNDGYDVFETGSLLATREDIIVVGASNRNNAKASFSSYGRTIDICAPGEGVMSIDKNGSEIYLDGTSFASPHVAAAVALIKAKNPSMTPAQLENELKKNVKVPNSWNTGLYGEGVLCFGDSDVEVPMIIASDIRVQEKATAQITVSDGNGTPLAASNCTYVSSNTGVAEVSPDGVVTGKAQGDAKITITTKDAKQLKTVINVTVTKADEDKTLVAYEWNPNVNSIELNVNETYRLSVNEVYSDGSKEDATSRVTLVATTPNVIDISGGTITAVSPGTTNIKFSATSLSGIRMPSLLKVKVKQVENPIQNQEENPTQNNEIIEPTIEKFEWSTDTATRLEVGETTQIKLYAVYSNGERVDVTNNSNLYSTNEQVVTINSSGRIKAVGIGKANIMMRSSSLAGVGTARAFSIIVTGVELERFEWSKSSIPDMEVGDTANIKIYAVYSDGSKNDVTQSSNIKSTDENVVKVDSNGKITAVGGGTANIIQGMAAIAGNIPSVPPMRITVNEPVIIEENTDFEYDNYGGGVIITAYTGGERYVTIPETLGGEDVVAIGKSVFKGNRSISSVSMPSTVEVIEDYAFANCKSLKTVHFSRAITEIGAHAFDDCTSLTGVSLPSRISEIAPYTFRGCTALKKIKIPAGVTVIAENAFANCKSLDINIPGSVEDIASSAFTSGNSIRISGSAGSVAESYAAEKGFSFN